MHINPLTAIDFYKADHRRQYPDGTTLVYSNLTPRSNKLSNLPDDNDSVTFFGLQYFIKHFLIEIWNDNFFKMPKAQVVSLYQRRMDTSLGSGAIPVDHIEALHDLGYLPIEIRALPEGSQVGIKVPCLTIHNTHPNFFWLVNYLESVMSCFLWKPCVSATTARWYRRTLERFAKETGGSLAFVQFQAHDFSFRGMSGLQDAALSGAAHLLSMVGTDTVLAIDFLEQYYNANAEKELVGCSVPATEHSVMCMGGQDDEIETFRRLITKLYPRSIVSIVSDTWDFWKVITEFSVVLKDEILAREGKVVFRPDSGDPVKIICGTAYKLMDSVEADMPHLRKMGAAGFEYFEHRGKYYHMQYAQDYNNGIPVEVSEVQPTPEMKGAITCLWEIFGGTTNEKGFKELDSHVGLIYGDSITPQRAQAILTGLRAKGFASTNIVFGVGSFTYQHVTRDTAGFAVKATYGEINGVGRAIFKSPKTDSGTKKSAKGILAVRNGKLYDEQEIIGLDVESDLKPVFKNGALLVDYTLAEVRKNAAA
jgi:nicotinamide phosphoribosyltransferase